MTYDRRGAELGRLFLADDPRWLKLNLADRLRAVDELAQVIQSAIEDWLDGLVGGGSGEVA